MCPTPQSILPTHELPLNDVLVPELYWILGTKYGHYLFARVMDGDNDDEAIEEITWGRLLWDALVISRELQRTAGALRSPVTVGLLASSGYTYYVHIVAAWLNGWTVMLLSNRNSTDGLESLLCQVGARALITDASHLGQGQELQDRLGDFRVVPFFDVPSRVDTQHSCMSSTRAQITSHDLDSVIAYTHTSGSQGHPKPVPLTHRYILADIKVKAVAKYAGAPVYAPLPLFHGMGFYTFTRWPIGSGVIPTFVRMRQPLNGDALLRHVRKLPGALCFLPPVVLEEVAHSLNADLSALTACRRIFFGGAPIERAAAKHLIQHNVPLVCVFGTSEFSVLSQLDFPSDNHLDDWEYIRPIENKYTLHFVPVDETPVRHLIVSPGSGGRPAVINCADPQGFASNGLWMPHPRLPGLWKHVGRKDAVTVLSTGEKTDNRQLESMLLVDPKISSVIVFGSGKPFNGVLILPALQEEALDPTTFVDEIWPTIEHANARLPSHSRLLREMVLIVHRKKSVAKTDKGTIRTAETLSRYAKEIESAYMRLELASTPHEPQSAILSNAIRQFVYNVAGRHLNDEENFFQAGLDSLHSVQLRHELLSILGGCKSVPYNVIYAHPTISSLIQYANNVHNGQVPHDQDQEKRTRLKNCIAKFSTNFGSLYRPPDQPRPDRHSILLTGGTGSLGCHILHELTSRDDVSRIYCLHRGPIKSSHLPQFEARGLTVDAASYDSKVQCLSCDLSHPNLDIGTSVMQQVQSEITHIVHIAWELNFNWELDMFEGTHIAGVKNLIDLAASCAKRRGRSPRLLFMSSIGAVGSCSRISNSSTPISEDAFDDPLTSNDRGYAESKFVAERLIHQACEGGAINASIIRAGQLSGSTMDGHWSSKEYIPTLFRTSLMLDAIPDQFLDARWLPVDVAASCIIDLIFHAGTYSQQPVYYHLENPTTIPWAEILNSFVSSTAGAIRAVPPEEWFRLVEESSGNTDILPAMSLLQFYRSCIEAGASNTWPTLDISKTKGITPAVDFGRISDELLYKYFSHVIAAMDENTFQSSTSPSVSRSSSSESLASPTTPTSTDYRSDPEIGEKIQ